MELFLAAIAIISAFGVFAFLVAELLMSRYFKHKTNFIKEAMKEDS